MIIKRYVPDFANEDGDIYVEFNNLDEFNKIDFVKKWINIGFNSIRYEKINYGKFFCIMLFVCNDFESHVLSINNEVERDSELIRFVEDNFIQWRVEDFENKNK